MSLVVSPLHYFPAFCFRGNKLSELVLLRFKDGEAECYSINGCDTAETNLNLVPVYFNFSWWDLYVYG